MDIIGVALILLGLIYIWKPTIFRRGVWLKTCIAIRTLSEENYRRYIRGLGVVMIIVGILIIARRT